MTTITELDEYCRLHNKSIHVRKGVYKGMRGMDYCVKPLSFFCFSFFCFIFGDYECKGIHFVRQNKNPITRNH